MGLSRNKVAVSEGAAGSPPFYGEREDMKIFSYSSDRFNKKEIPDLKKLFNFQGLLRKMQNAECRTQNLIDSEFFILHSTFFIPYMGV